jgi:fatty-acyl-CoA synthase
VYHGERRCCTWRELRDRTPRLAGSIRQHCPAAARLAIVSENRPEIVELLFGIWAAECVAVPINYKLHPRVVVQILEDAGVSQVLASATIAVELGSSCGFPVENVEAENYSHRLTTAPASAPCTDPSKLAWLFYTSGTTGRSKGAMLTHRNLMAMTIAHLADIDAPDEGCSLLHAAPMSHGSGLYIPADVPRGARQVVPQRVGFSPGDFLDLCEHHPGCSAFLAPTMVQRVIETGRTCPSQLRTIVYGGAPM